MTESDLEGASTHLPPDAYAQFLEDCKDLDESLALPAPGKFVQKHNCVTVPFNHEIVGKVGKALHAAGATFEFCQADSFFQGDIVGGNYYECTFKVFLYADDTQKKIVVELQRRNGDGMLFQEVYETVRDQLLGRNKSQQRKPTTAKVPRSFKTAAVLWGVAAVYLVVTAPDALTLHARAATMSVIAVSIFFLADHCSSQLTKDDLSGIPTIDGDNDVLECLKVQFISEFSDVRFEGARALTLLSANDLNRDAMVSWGALELLSRGVREQETESIRRCAATAIANLVGKLSPSQKIFSGGDDALLVSLCQLSETKRPVVLREAARALSALTPFFLQSNGQGKQFKKNVMMAIEKLCGCADASVQAEAQKLWKLWNGV